MATIKSIVGKVARVVVQKGILRLEIMSVKGNFPDDISTWEGGWAVVHSDEDVTRLPGRQKTPIEEEADRQREREDTSKYEAPINQLDPPEPAEQPPSYAENRDIICNECLLTSGIGTWGPTIEPKEEVCAWCGREHAVNIVDARMRPNAEGQEQPKKKRQSAKKELLDRTAGRE